MPGTPLPLHCVQRYGLPEVREWYFEVWNEPNLDGFSSGTVDEYWELYRQSALAVKRGIQRNRKSADLEYSLALKTR